MAFARPARAPPREGLEREGLEGGRFGREASRKSARAAGGLRARRAGFALVLACAAAAPGGLRTVANWARAFRARYGSPVARERPLPAHWKRRLTQEEASAFVARLGRYAKVTEHLEAAAAAFTVDGALEPQIEALAAAERATWLAIHLVLEAWGNPRGKSAAAILDLAARHGHLVPFVRPRETKTQKIDRLRADLRATLEGANVNDDARRFAPWSLAAETVAMWAECTIPGTMKTGDGLAWRFLARVALRVPRKTRELEALAHETLVRYAFGAALPEAEAGPGNALTEALARAWLAAGHSKTIAEAGASWFLDRAVEAMGEEPRIIGAAERKRTSRARRRKV